MRLTINAKARFPSAATTLSDGSNAVVTELVSVHLLNMAVSYDRRSPGRLRPVDMRNGFNNVLTIDIEVA